jgi:hypothetical protein
MPLLLVHQRLRSHHFHKVVDGYQRLIFGYQRLQQTVDLQFGLQSPNNLSELRRNIVLALRALSDQVHRLKLILRHRLFEQFEH